MKRFEYNERNKDQQDDFIIPPYLFEEPKPRIVVEFPFCELNEKRVSTFNKRIDYWTNDSYDLNVVWKNKKVRSFFLLKDKNLYPSCKIYYGLCSCEVTLERPKEMFLYIMMNITNSLKPFFTP